MDGLTIRKAQRKVERFLRERGWLIKTSLGRYYTLSHTMEELGEVARCITVLESKRSEIMGVSKKDILENLKFEIGDLMYHVLKLACVCDIDAEVAFMKSMNKNEMKFPVERFKKFKQF